MVWKSQLGWQKEQEDNLLYVALTRSKSTLYIVGQPDWFKDDKEQNGHLTLVGRPDKACPHENEDEETFLTFGETSNDNTDKDAKALATSTAELETSRTSTGLSPHRPRRGLDSQSESCSEVSSEPVSSAT